MPGKKMVDIDVLETSGVDHPAHLHEGFAVMKSADPTTARAIMSALGKDRKMTGKTASTAAAPDALTAAAAEAISKAIDSKLQPVLDQMAEAWKGLRDYAETTDADVPSTEGTPAPADAAAPPAPVLAAADAELLKALPEPVRLLIEKSSQAVAKAQADAADATKVAKAERDARLDGEAIAKAADTYGNLNLPADTVKALRRIESISPELHKSLDELLVSTNAQLDGAALTKEFGNVRTAADPATAEGKVEAMAKALVTEGKFDTIQKARAHVYETNADLTNAVRKEA